jgi:hypothetical protein
MNCHILFPVKYALDQLGVTFVSQTVKQTAIKELMLQQRAELDTIGELVEWTKECRNIQKNMRYGIDIRYTDEETNQTSRFPPKPKRSAHQTGIMGGACPVSDCRGTVVNGTCGICRAEVCLQCSCKINPAAAHNCDPDILETMKELRETTKPCPKCSSRIHKTEGCDHMHCTNCDTHFSWKHLTILTNSTNHHYRNRLIRTNVAIDADNTEYCAVSMDDPRIPKEILLETLDRAGANTGTNELLQTLLETLYEVTMSVRYLKRAEYSEIEIAKRTRDKYDELQIKYAMNEITDKEWEKQVYRTHIKQQSYELIGGILHIYLANMDGIQSELYHYAINHYAQAQEHSQMQLGEFVDKINRLTAVVNEQIEEIREEYDPTNMTVLQIRSVGQADTGFCTKQTVAKQHVKKAKATAKTKANAKEPSQIQLYPYQIEHVDRLLNFLQKSHFAIDLSPLGTGKTYCAAKIFQEAKIFQSNHPQFKHLIAISPPSVKTKWLEVEETYGMECTALLTYGEITGRKFCNPKCGYIIRNDYKVPVVQENGEIRMIDKYNYKTTREFEDLVNEGVFLVLDEFQQVKNECAQTEACEVLIRSILANYKKGGPLDVRQSH